MGETLFHINEEMQKYPRIHEFPFDSQRKMMTTMHRQSDGVVLQFTKGAMDVVFTALYGHLAQSENRTDAGRGSRRAEPDE